MANVNRGKGNLSRLIVKSGLVVSFLAIFGATIVVPAYQKASAEVVLKNPSKEEALDDKEPKTGREEQTSEVPASDSSDKQPMVIPEDAKESAKIYTNFAAARKASRLDPSNQSLKRRLEKTENDYRGLKAKEDKYDKENPCPEQKAYEATLTPEQLKDKDGEPSQVTVGGNNPIPEGKDEG